MSNYCPLCEKYAKELEAARAQIISLVKAGDTIERLLTWRYPEAKNNWRTAKEGLK